MDMGSESRRGGVGPELKLEFAYGLRFFPYT